jgi:hypothetical protein
MSTTPLNDPSRIQQIRILNPYLLDNATTVEGAKNITGLPEDEARTLLPANSEWIPLSTLQHYILGRNREKTPTLYGTLLWLSVRGIEIPDEDEWLASSVRQLLWKALPLVDCYNNSTAHHICGDRQYLEFVGPDFFSPETLLIENHYKDTAADWAAKNGNLRLVSKELLTREVVLHRNVVNWTLIHHAAYGSCLTEIPPRYITPETVFDRTVEALDDATAVPQLWPSEDQNTDMPWERLKECQWINALSKLHEVAKHHPSPSLANLIRRTECLKRLKAVTPLET